MLLREHLDAIVGALPEAAAVVSTSAEVFAANRGARAALAPGARDLLTLASIATSPTDLTDYLRLCARSFDPLPGTLRIRGEGAEPVAFACHAGLLSRADGENPALVLVRFARKHASDPFLQLNQTIAQLNEEVRRRRDAEERLRVLLEETKARSEERFRLLVDSVKDYAIFMLGPGGHVMTWNAGAARINGYAAHEIVGKHFSTFYPAEDVAAGKCERELEVATREGRFEEEGWRIRQNGTRLWANVTITPLREPSGALLGFAKVTRDLTERKRHEEELRRLAGEKASLEEKARTQEFQERFIAILGHDLRNPLAAIDMGAGVLRQRAGATDEVGARVLDRMKASSRRMSRMIEQILDLTRSRLTGGLTVSRTRTDLAVTLTAIVDECRAAHPSRAIALRCPATLVGEWDRDRLEQVFSNLVGNAVHHGLPEQPVAVDAREGADEVEVCVHNAGPPISEELRAVLFNPFRRGERDSRTADTEGLGLGLYISREIVLAHGGEIDVRSNAVEGTTFRVVLPRAATAVLPASGQKGAS